MLLRFEITFLQFLGVSFLLLSSRNFVTKASFMLLELTKCHFFIDKNDLVMLVVVIFSTFFTDSQLERCKKLALSQNR